MKKILFSVLGIAFLITPFGSVQATASLDENVLNTVFVLCGDIVDDDWDPVVSGSGVVFVDNLALTNAHVVLKDDGSEYDLCLGGVAEDSHSIPELEAILVPMIYRIDDQFDYAFIEAVDIDGEDYNFPSEIELANADALILGEDITVLGYPGIGGDTITSTNGTIAGFDDSTWIKSDAIIEEGNSGGAAFDVLGNFIGLPTYAKIGSINSISYIQNINAIIEDAFGEDFIERDLSTLYSQYNFVCISDSCYNFATDEDTWQQDIDLGETEVSLPDEAIIQSISEPLNSSYDPASYDSSLQERLLGTILLQVEEHGEAWYVNPVDKLRYYMADGSIAYEMMRSFGLGITDVDLAKISSVDTPEEVLSSSSICSSNSMAKSLRGRILLQVEQHGEAWYVDPDTCRMIYMEDGAAAYSIMRFLSLGIENSDLVKLPAGNL